MNPDHNHGAMQTDTTDHLHKHPTTVHVHSHVKTSVNHSGHGSGDMMDHNMLVV